MRTTLKIEVYSLCYVDILSSGKKLVDKQGFVGEAKFTDNKQEVKQRKINSQSSKIVDFFLQLTSVFGEELRDINTECNVEIINSQTKIVGGTDMATKNYYLHTPLADEELEQLVLLLNQWATDKFDSSNKKSFEQKIGVQSFNDEDENDVPYGPNWNSLGKMSDADLRKKIEAALQTEIAIQGSDKGLPSVDELMKRYKK